MRVVRHRLELPPSKEPEFDMSDKVTVPSCLLSFLGQQPVFNVQNNRGEKSSCSAQAIYLYYKL